MNLKDAEELRCVRFYQWALQTMQNEVQKDFPLLSKVRSPGTFGTLLRVRQYPPQAVEDVALLAVKRGHLRALEILGEQLTNEESDFVAQYWKEIWSDRIPFNLQEFEQQFLTLPAGMPGLSHEFRSKVVKQLTEYFGVKSQKLDSTDFLFHNTIGDWNVETRCQLRGKNWKHFNCMQYIYRCDHDNVSEEFGNSHNMNLTRILNNGITNIVKMLAINGGTEWSETRSWEEETVVQEIMTVIPAFHDHLPAMLHGLDRDS